MNNHITRPLLSVLALALLLPQAIVSAQEPIPIAAVNRAQPVSFQREILPLFRKSCLACHDATEAYGDLVLETPASLLTGGDSGAAVVPGKGAESFLLKVASHQEEPIMPPADNDVAAPPLTPQELGLIKLWIDQGAKADAAPALNLPEGWRPLPPGLHPIYAVDVTSDGQFVACSRANQVFIYHAPTGQLVTRLNDPALQADASDPRPGVAHLDVVQSLAFNREGDMLASGGFRNVKLWRFPRDVRRLSLAATDTVTAVAVSADRQTLATGVADHSIRLWNLETGDPGPTLTGHEGPVSGLRFSWDDARLYSASSDKTIRVWNVADGTAIGRIDTPTLLSSLTTLVLPPPTAAPAENADQPSSAGTLAEGEQQAVTEPAKPVEQLATAGGDNFIRLWNVPDGLPQPLADVPAGANVLAVSPDRRVVAVAGSAGEIRIVEAETGELINTWQAHDGAIHAVSFAPVTEPPPADADNGTEDQPSPAVSPRRLATAGADGTVRLWNHDTAEPLLVLRGGLSEITALAFRPDGKHIVAGAADGSVSVWNLEVSPTAPLAPAGDAVPTVVVTSRDGKLLAASGVIGGRPAIVVRELPAGTVVHTLLGHEAGVTALAFSNDGKQLVSGSADKTARVWDLTDAKFPELTRFAGHGAAVGGVAFNADATQALSGSADNSVKLWTVADGELVTDFAGHTGPVVAAVMAGNQAVSASADGTIRVWDAAAGTVQRTIPVQTAVTALALRPDGNVVAAAAADQTIRLYQLADSQLLQTLHGHEAAINTVAFSPDGTRLVSAATDGRAITWNAASGRMVEILPVEAGLAAAVFGQDGNHIALFDKAGHSMIQQLRLSLTLNGMAQPVTGLAYSGNGQTVYTACADGTVRGFTEANGAQTFSANHGAAVHGLALSGDGQRLASAGEDQLVKLWNATNGLPLAPTQFAGFTGPVRSVCFAGDGRRLIGGADAGQILVFNAADGSLEQAVTAHAKPVDALVAAGASGDWIVSASADDLVASWTPSAERRFAGHTQPVTSLATVRGEPDEILSGSLDGTLRRWNIATGQATQQFSHGGPITAVAASGSGERFASASSNKTAKLFDAANGQPLAEMRGDLRAKALVAKLTQEKSAATAKVDAARKVVAAAEQALPVKTTAEQTATTALAAARQDVDAKQAALAQVTNTKAQAEQAAIQAAAAAQIAAREKQRLEQLALAAMEKAEMLAAKSAVVTAAAQADPDNTALAQAAEAASMAAGNADAQAKAAQSAAEAPALAAANAGKAATDAATKAAAVGKPFIDAATALAQAETNHKAAMQAHAVAVRDREAATAAIPAAKAELAKVEATLTQIDADLAAAVEAEAQAHQPLNAIAFSPDGRTLATGGELGVVHTWDAETGKALASYVGHAGPIQSVAYVSAGEMATGAADKTAAVWNVNPNWRLERVVGEIANPGIFADRVVAVDFSDHGRLLATGGGVPSRSGEIKVINVADGSVVLEIPDAHTDQVNAVAFSPDGALLASAGSDKYVKVFDVATGEKRLQLEGHTEHALSVSWRAGGSLLASAGGDGTIRIWNAETGDRVRTIEGYTKHVTAVRYVGQSQFIVSTSGERIVRMHNTDNGGVQRNFAGATQYMYCVDATADPNNGILVAGGHDSVLRIWHLGNGQQLQNIEPPE
jgi:WD40 repeat protein